MAYGVLRRLLSLEGLVASTSRPGIRAWLLAFGLVFSLGAASGGYWPTAWGWSALVLLCICAVALLVRSGVRLGRLELTVSAGLLGLFGWGLASALWSSSATGPFAESQRTLVYAAGVLAALLIVRSRSHRALLVGVWSAVALIAGYSLLTRLFPERFGFVDSIAGYRLDQPLGYWNALGIFAALGALLALGLAARASRPALRALAAASIVVLLPTLYFTFSRGSWLALGAGTLAAIALDRRRLQLISVLLVIGPWPALAVWVSSRSGPLTSPGVKLGLASHAGHRFALVIVGLALVAAAAAVAQRWVGERLKPSPAARRASAAALAAAILAAVGVALARYGDPVTAARSAYDSFTGSPVQVRVGQSLNKRLFSFSSNGRIDLWRVAWRDYAAHPWLGSGSGSYERYWNQLRPVAGKVVNAHSLYVETLAELGPVGLGLLLVTLCAPIVAAVRARRRSLASVALGAYVAFLVHAAVDWDWQVPAVTLAALFCGCAVLAAARGVGEPGRRLRIPRVPAVAVTVALAAFAFVGLRGNEAISSAEAAASKSQWKQAAADARSASDWAPWSARPWQLLGEAQYQEGKRAAARASFRRAIAADPSDWSIWLDLAVAGTGAERRQAFAQASRLNPLSPEIASYRGPGGG